MFKYMTFLDDGTYDQGGIGAHLHYLRSTLGTPQFHDTYDNALAAMADAEHLAAEGFQDVVVTNREYTVLATINGAQKPHLLSEAEAVLANLFDAMKADTEYHGTSALESYSEAVAEAAKYLNEPNFLEA